MPNKDEVIRYFKWREADAVRNSIQALGQANFSHKQLHGKNQNEIQDMLFKEKDINWNDYTSSEKRGTYFRKVKVFRRFSEEELKNLPPKHNARKDPKLLIERSDVIREYFPIFTKIKNQEEVLFDGKDPVT